MLNATPNWRAAFSSDAVQPRLVGVLQVSTGSVEGTNVFTFSSGPTPYAGITSAPSPPCSLDCNPSISSGEINPSSRQTSIGQLTLTFARDGALTDLIARSVLLKNKTISLYLVEAFAAWSDALRLGTFIIDDIRSSDGVAIQLLLKDGKALSETNERQQFSSPGPWGSVTGSSLGPEPVPQYQFPCKHPLELIAGYSIPTAGSALGWLTQAGVPTSLQGPSLQPSTWAGSIGHFNVSRFSTARSANNTPMDDTGTVFSSYDGGITGALNLRDLIAEMERLLGGLLWYGPNAAGTGDEWQFKRWDPSVAVVDTWVGLHDIDELEVVESWAEIYNSGRIKYASGLSGSELQWIKNFGNSGPPSDNGYGGASMHLGEVSLELQDTSAIAALSFGPNDSGLRRYELSSDWLNGVVPMAAVSFTGTTGNCSFVVTHASILGVCGCRYDEYVNSLTVPPSPSAYTIPSWAVCSSSQPTYLRISGNGTDEILAVTTIDGATGGDWCSGTAAGLPGSWLPSAHTFHALAANRGLFGTTARNWSFAGQYLASVEDITIQVYLFRNLINRAGYGLPKLRATTGWKKMPVEIGDLIAINDLRGIMTGFDHIDPSAKWEVTSKRVTGPKIEWTLSMALNPAALSTNYQRVQNLWYGPRTL